jgi:hypothetical protein
LAILPLEPNLLEEGALVHTAERMLAGERLYRDILVFAGPLPFELLALLFRIFGTDILVARFALLPLIALATTATYLIAHRSGTGPLAHVAAAVWASAPILLFPLVTIFFWTVIAFYLVPVAVYVALRGIESNRWAVLAGCLVGAVALCKQSSGAVLAAGLFAALVACAPAHARRSRALAMILGGTGLAIATVGLFAARGDLTQLLFATVKLPLSLGESFRAPYFSLWPIGKVDPDLKSSMLLYLPYLYYLKYGVFAKVDTTIVLLTQLLFALPLLALLATGLLRLWKPLPIPVWLHTAGLLALVADLYPRGDWGHLVHVLPASLTQLVLLAGARVDREGRASLVARPAAVVICFAIYTCTVSIATWLVLLSAPSAFGPRVPLRPVSGHSRAASIPRVIEYLRERVGPNEAIFVARQEPLIYFATGTRNPTPFEGMITGYREEQEKIILSELADVRYVVMSDIDQPNYHYYADELPGVQAYFERHFAVPPDFLIDQHSWIVPAVRGKDRGPVLIDLVKERPHASAWLAGPGGRTETEQDELPKLGSRQFRRLFPIMVAGYGGGIDFQIEVPQDALFQADIGLTHANSARGLHMHQAGTVHAVSISRPDGQFDTLEVVRLTDIDPLERARWHPIEVDLSPWAGEAVTLRLEVRTERGRWVPGVEWWGSPRIARKLVDDELADEE